MIRQYKKFSSAKEMVNWLIDNESIELYDEYGRRWMYKNYSFHYSNLKGEDWQENTINCLHLFSENMYYLINN